MSSSPASVEAIEEELADVPHEDLLEGATADSFRRTRKAIGARQRQWRDGMDSLAMLFDGDAHRAKALAGNLATELEMMLAAWADAVAGGAGVDPSRAEKWLAATAAAWQEPASRFGRAQDWDGEAVEVFDDFLSELSERGRARASERLRDAGARSGGSARSPWPLRKVGSLVVRWLRPDVDPTPPEEPR